MASFIVYLYGALLFVGGIFGHLKAGSRASLITSMISAFLLLLCALSMHKKKQAGWVVALLITLALDLFFLYRTYLTMRFFPSGMMTAISSFTAIALWGLRRGFFPPTQKTAKPLSTTRDTKET